MIWQNKWEWTPLDTNHYPHFPSHYLTIIDIKDYFSIPLLPDDIEKFALHISSANFCQPNLRFEWTVLPQGMTSYSSVLYATYFSSLIGYLKMLFYIYKYDIILGYPKQSDMQDLTGECLTILQTNDFKVATEEIQNIPPLRILVSMLFLDTVSPSKPHLHIQGS